MQNLRRVDLQYSVLATEAIHRRCHFEFTKASSRSFFGRRVSRYPNSDSTFQIIRILTSWDVNLNPGPCTEKPKCHTCSRTIARNHRSLQCNSCGLKYHIKCGNVTPKLFNRIQSGDVIYEQRERVFHRDIQTRENNV